MADVSLNVNTGDQAFTIETDSLAELAQLLKLAGVSTGDSPATPVMDPEAPWDQGCMDVDVDSDGALVPTEENADYDYGINPTSRKGYEYNTDPYQYQGNAQIPVRYVPAKSGDNPLPLWNENAKPLAAYLQEVEDSRRLKSVRLKTR